MNKETKQVKENRRNIVVFIIVLTLLSGLVILFAWDGIIEEVIQTNKGMDLFCQEKGYNKSTDYVYINCGWSVGEEYRVECDGDRIFPVVDYEPCIKWDKWGRCNEEGREVKDYLGNTTC